MKRLAFVLLCMLPLAACAAKEHPEKSQTTSTNSGQPVCVTLATTDGNILLKLNSKKAPVSVANFLHYVDSGFYNGTIFHRVIGHFMIQGGGFDQNGNLKNTQAPIINESDNGLKNYQGTIAMARTRAPNSATAQFFINLVNNPRLNYQPSKPTGNGYAVFGKVIDGMDVVNAIGQSRTHMASLNGYSHRNVPVSPIVINKAVQRSCPAT